MDIIKQINEIAKDLEIPNEYLEYYGKYKAKISNEYYNKIKQNKDAKLILVTSINPTPLGEGKTTQAVGIAMGMSKIGKKTIVALREPSLGPVFGVKGGAIGGGMATVEPHQEIDLHFTGDFHAITSANNLLVAALENHIYQGNHLNIDINNICIKRVIDMNDRGLRNITVKIKDMEYNTGFDITASCELMAICCLSENLDSLKLNIDNMLVAYDNTRKPVYARDLNVTSAMIALLKDILKPNLVQTVGETPCLIHLGPFANIAHGCNSVIATKMGMKMCDYLITEAGFGSDLGAEKFFNIKCRKAGLKPDLVVLVATTRAIKYNGGADINNIIELDLDALKNGICNLEAHIDNLRKFDVNILVCINRYIEDHDEEIEYLIDFCDKIGVKSQVSTVYEKGAEGAIDIANLIVDELNNNSSNLTLTYDDSYSIEQKIEIVCKQIYGSDGVNYSDIAKENINNIKKLNLDDFPICIAKTPMSLSDDPNLLGRPKHFKINIKNVKINSGAGFIVVYTSNVITLPGLGKKCKYEEF